MVRVSIRLAAAEFVNAVPEQEDVTSIMPGKRSHSQYYLAMARKECGGIVMSAIGAQAIFFIYAYCNPLGH